MDFLNPYKRLLPSIPDDIQHLVLVFVVLILVVNFFNVVYQWWTRDIITVEVLSKTRVFYPASARSMYLVFTTKGVLKNSDTIAYLKFNSSDIQSELEAGYVYELVVCGNRSKWRSDYKNIVKVRSKISPADFSPPDIFSQLKF